MARRVLVTRPDGSTIATLSVDMAATFAWAAQDRMAACVLRPRVVADEALFSLTPKVDPQRLEPQGLRGSWWRARWRWHAFRRGIARQLARRSASFWLELYRELRRHGGDERLPYGLRNRLRSFSQRAFRRAHAKGSATSALAFPRRLLSQRVPVELPSGRLVSARNRAQQRGIERTKPIVALDTPTGVERFSEAIEMLVADGYQVVRIGSAPEPVDRAGVVDLACDRRPSRSLNAYVLLRAKFLVCTSASAQHVAYLTNTPCLTLDVTDPIREYPVRPDGAYLLAPAVEFDTGRDLPLGDLLSERYLRNPARFGHRRNTSAEILAAVREMSESVAGNGWRESERQGRFRGLVLEASTSLETVVPAVAIWGAEDGFVGEGRLAAVQADVWP